MLINDKVARVAKIFMIYESCVLLAENNTENMHWWQKVCDVSIVGMCMKNLCNTCHSLMHSMLFVYAYIDVCKTLTYIV